MQWIYTGWLIASMVGISTNDLSQVGAYSSSAQILSALAPSAVWALVALISVVGLIKLYRDKSKDDEQLKTIIAETTRAVTQNTVVLDKLSDKIDRCPTGKT